MQAFRASILDFIDDPASAPEHCLRYFEDGLLLIDQGLVSACGDYASLKSTLAEDVEIVDYSGRLIMPGFIDAHLHYAQTDIIASHGSQLLDWLERYTFPEERRFSDAAHAQQTAGFFIQELLRNGTTTALVFATVHTQSVDAIFAAAAEQNMRLISGKVMMDRHAPDFLCDTAQSSYDDSLALIQKWHHHQRLLYAVTPRFAPTSSPEQLSMAQLLLNQFPDLYLQSHVAEHPGEVEWVKSLFPWSRSYLDVYDHFGLLGDRSLYAHCIHLDDADRQRLAVSGTAVAFCPSSNLFLGSGLFDMQAMLQQPVNITIGTDVGAGTSFSLLKTLNDGYKVCQLGGYNLSPLQAFYLLTLGAARALYLDRQLGNFEQGKEADFVVIDLHSTPLIQRRMAHAQELADQLFVLMLLGDERNITATYIMGNCCYRADAVPC